MVVLDPNNNSVDGNTTTPIDDVILSGGAFNASESVSFGGACRDLSYAKQESPPCVDVNLTLTTDSFPNETNVTLVDLSNGTVYWDEFIFNTPQTTYELIQCVDPEGCYEVTINDLFGDGLFPDGIFILTFDGELVASEVNFGYSVVYYVGYGCEEVEIFA